MLARLAGGTYRGTACYPPLIMILVACLLALHSQDPAALIESSPPNIVVFLVDDLGWRDVGFQGSRFYETPHLDSFAGEGLVFERAYSNAPNCAPSRAALMSGQYAPRTGIYTVGGAARGNAAYRRLVPVENRTDLSTDAVTFAEVLQAAGYRTATMGKWHLGDDPTQHGFDVNVGGNKTGTPKGGHFSPYKNPQLADGEEGESLTARLTDSAVEFIGENKERPFLLYLSHYAVHTPIQTAAELQAKYKAKEPTDEQKNAKYAGMIESVDASFGRVMAALAEHGLADNTLVVFTSDNGGHGSITSNVPLRGAKGMLYEGGIRVPLAMRWPGKIEPGSTTRAPVIGTDLYPTLLAVAGVPEPKKHVLDGFDLTPLWTEGAEFKRAGALFWHFPAYLEQGKKSPRPFRTRPAGAVRVGEFKLIEFFEDGRLELYDTDADEGEAHNLADELPGLVEALQAEMTAWRFSTKAPIPTTKNPEFDAAALAKRLGG